MTRSEAKQKVIDLARAEIGYREKASNKQLNDKTANSGSGNWTKYAEFLDSYAGFYNGPKNGYAWCDVFYDYLFVKCFGLDIGRQMLCQPLNSAGAGCLFSAQYYKQAGRWHANAPQAGDQIFFTYSPGEYSHTGLVEAVNGDTVTTIEGNTSDGVGRRNYNIANSTIAGYGRPKWELAVDENTATAELPLTQEAPKEKVEEHHWKPGTLKRDDRYNVSVVVMQALLTARGFNCGQIDGYFGPLTEIAVNHAKRYYSMERNGECDYPLWIKLLLIER